MEHSPSWEASSHSASQKVLRLLWNPTVHYRVHRTRHQSESDTFRDIS